MNKNNNIIENDDYIVEDLDLNEEQATEEGVQIKDKGAKPLVLILILFVIAVITALGANIFDRNAKQRELAEMQQVTEDEISRLSEQCEADADELSEKLAQMNEYLTKLEESVTNNQSSIDEYVTNNTSRNVNVDLTKGMSAISKQLSQVHNDITAAKLSISSLVSELSKNDASRHDEIMKQFDGLKEAIKNINSGYSNTNSEVEKMISELGKDNASDHKDIINKLSDISKEMKSQSSTNISDITKSLEKMESTYKALIAGLEALITKNFDSLNKTVEEQYGAINNTVNEFKDELNQVSDYLVTMDENITNNSKLIEDYINNSENTTNIVNEISQDIDSLSGELTSIHTDITAAKEKIAGMLDELEAGDEERQKEVMSQFGVVREKIAAIQTNFDKAHDEVKKMIQALSETENENHKELVGKLTTIESKMTEQSNESLSDLLNSLSDIENTYKELIVGLEELMASNFNTLNDTVNNRYDSLTESISNQYEKITNNMSQGNKDTNEALSRIEGKIDSVFQLVSSGKKLVASAITDKGIDAQGDATFEVFSALIGCIGNEVVNTDSGNLLSGTKLYDGVSNTYVEGTMPNNGRQDDFAPSEPMAKTYAGGYYPSAWTVDTTNAYQKGYIDGKADVPNASIRYEYHVHRSVDGEERNADYVAGEAGGCFCAGLYNGHEHVIGRGTKVKDVNGKVAYTGAGGCYLGKSQYVSSTERKGYERELDTTGGIHYACPICDSEGEPGSMCYHNEDRYSTCYVMNCKKVAGEKYEDEGTEGYTLSCGKRDYATAGEDADITRATIVFEE